MIVLLHRSIREIMGDMTPNERQGNRHITKNIRCLERALELKNLNGEGGNLE